MRSRILVVLATVAALLAEEATARADDVPWFHRTTPRAALAGAPHVLVIGIPGGRAWGIESEPRVLPPPGTILVARLAVSDPLVKEAFVRVAYYGPSTGHGRQLAIADSAPVARGERAVVSVELDPPSGAVAYRIRVLARLSDRDARSADDAVEAVLHAPASGARTGGCLYSRLLP